MTTTPVPHRFAGKTAIVTGAGSGIGRATAIRLSHEGARVIATDVVERRLDELARETGRMHLTTVAGDVTSEETIARVIGEANGKVDALANIAGVMDGFLPTAELDDATWERVMEVNVTAVMRMCRAVIPLMLDRNGGSIVNVSSEAGLRGSAAGTAYTASKHAVNGITRSTAFYYTPRGIRCNAVAPGPVATNIEAPFLSQYAAERIGPYLRVNVPSAATPEDLAAAITWLLSDDAANVSGAILLSDGGWAAI